MVGIWRLHAWETPTRAVALLSSARVGMSLVVASEAAPVTGAATYAHAMALTQAVFCACIIGAVRVLYIATNGRPHAFRVVQALPGATHATHHARRPGAGDCRNQ